MNKKIILFLIMATLLCGCNSDKDTDLKPRPGDFSYPKLRYFNSSIRFDMYNRDFPIEDGFILNEGHSYDLIETEEGYDLVLHFIKEE